MDDFERGAREMQRVAAEALDEMALRSDEARRVISKGINPHRWTALLERSSCCREAASYIRSISIEGAINAVVGDER